MYLRSRYPLHDTEFAALCKAVQKNSPIQGHSTLVPTHTTKTREGNEKAEQTREKENGNSGKTSLLSDTQN